MNRQSGRADEGKDVGDGEGKEEGGEGGGKGEEGEERWRRGGTVAGFSSVPLSQQAAR